MEVNWKSLSTTAAVLVCLLTTTILAAPPKKQAAKNSKPTLATPTPDPISTNAIDWLADYGEAMRRAELGRKMMLVYFYNPDGSNNQERFERESLADAEALGAEAAERILGRRAS